MTPEERWNTLKNVITAMSAKTELIPTTGDEDSFYTSDQMWGFDECLIRLENLMEKLEEMEEK